MRKGFFFLLASSLFLSGCAGTPPQQAAAPPAFKPVGTTLQVMQAMIIPAADAVWAVGAEAPKNDEEWAKVRNNALMLAEAGNLLMIGDRAKDQDAWMQMSLALVDAGTAAFQAAEAKNAEGVMMAGDAIYNSCEGCHMKYPPQTAAPQ
ncbi:MAG: hypothetical protein ACRD88_21100 [Terriglobia bacterium]